MRITTTIMTAVIAFAALSGVTISAQEGPTPEQQAVMATENRQAVFKLLGVNMGPIVGMARGAVPFDASIAERNARRIAMLAPMIPELVGAMDTREFENFPSGQRTWLTPPIPSLTWPLVAIRRPLSVACARSAEPAETAMTPSEWTTTSDRKISQPCCFG
jgi:hypothetical protein